MYVGENLSQTMFTAGHCGHARSEMRRAPLLTCVSSPIMSCVQEISCFRLAVSKIVISQKRKAR